MAFFFNSTITSPRSFFSLFLHLLFFIFLLPFSNPIYFNFSSFEFNNSTINYTGAAYPSNGLIRLTSETNMGIPLTNSVGRATYSEPITLWNTKTQTLSDFTTHFSFTAYSPSLSTTADGIAFFFAPVGSGIPNNSPGAFLGVFNASAVNSSAEISTVAVEFDTYSNSWDPTSAHVGIDINSIVSVANVIWHLLNDGSTAGVWINYNATTKNLSVFLRYEDFSKGHSSLSYIVDLMKILPERVFVGFSASTGWEPAIHTILSREFNSSFAVSSQVGIRRNKIKTRWIIGISLSMAVIICGIGCVLAIFSRRRQKKEEMACVESFDGDLGRGPRRFSYKELVIATNNFSKEGKLGEGGFGEVYKGSLKDPILVVAVKKISRGSRQGKKEYVSEVKIISQLRHRNLVQLIGWSHDRGEFILVYEFMPNGSLDSQLFGERSQLTWAARFKIGLGLASGVLYLHEELEQCVVHRDIKSSNVMLDSGFNAKLGDFGLARLVDHELGSQTTMLAGTRGYMAPECATIGKPSKHCDVFSFGVVALEIACGRRPIDLTAEAGEVLLVEWVWDLYGRGRIFDAVDRNLKMDFDEKEMESLITVGLWCAHPDYSMRPTIRQVIQVLNFEASLPELPKKMPVPIYSTPPASTHSGQSAITCTGYSSGR